jgi:Zn-dependent peptidase ImmA (M78 family)
MINGERVRQARELRGMTQAELADRMDVSQSLLAKIETGFVQPSEETLDVLVATTGFPSAFFRQQPVDFPLGSLLFRARVATTASEKWKAYRFAQILFELALKLGQQLNEIPLVLPRISGNPSDPVEPTDAARRARSDLGFSPDIPIENLTREIERKGVLVLALPMQLTGIDAFAVWAGTDKPRPVIVLSADAPGDRQRWSMAHEIGHLVMHQAPEGTLSQIEHEANQFAAEFLLPEIAMQRELTVPITLTGLAQLKLRWKVSIQALIRRAHDLAIITDRQYRSLFEQLGSYGWRIREPINLDIPAERPRALREMAEVLSHGRIEYDTLARTMLLSVDDVKLLLSAFAGKDSAGGDTPDSSPKILPFAKREQN